MENKEIVVSICCAAYNHEKYIKQCLDGFMMQKTNFAYEVLIHDDASTDKTADIIREYERNYPDIIKPIYQKENKYSQGIHVTRTYNYPRAKGKYIALCEGDDYWIDPFKLQKQVDFLEKNEDVSLYVHNSKIIFLNTNTVRLFNENRSSGVVTWKSLILSGWFTPTASFVYRKVILESKYYEKRMNINGDMRLLCLAASHGKVYYSDEVMSVYRYLSEYSLSRSTSKFTLYHKKWNLMNYIDIITNGRYVYYTLIKRILIIAGVLLNKFIKR